ncbi:MAG: amino acid permease [Clostridia bacterium]|nr:amino acid permease [Clostridia bacterium]
MQDDRRLTRNLSPFGAWAFSIGTSIGWGSLVVTSNTYLAQAGPLGSTVGMIAGGLIMLVIAANYAYLMNVYPDAGGAYHYASEILGHDYGFLTAWFLSLTYLAILWANATSIPLFARYFLGDVFKVGRLYTLFGYDVYLGEALLSIAALLLVALLCARRKGTMAKLMIAMAVVFTAGIVVCFAAGIRGSKGNLGAGYVPGSPVLSQIVRIAVISPWAFIGFENISHATEEMSFKNTRLYRVLFISVISTTALYIFVTLLSVTAYPGEYRSWLDYIQNREHLEGLKGLPAFYAANRYMGKTGVVILMLALLSLIVTSLIGNITALSRLFYALGRDSILPVRFGKLNDRDVPANAIALIVALSALFPFLGRTAIGWIVDVTTIGATLIYGLVSASAMKLARERRDGRERWLGVIGLAMMVCFGIYTLVPNLYTSSTMARESYFFFIVWSALGFVYFRRMLRVDKARRFGKSIVVWIALFSLVLFVSLVYLVQSIIEVTGSGMRNIEQFYVQNRGAGIQAGVVSAQLTRIRQVTGTNVTAVVALITLSLYVLIGNFRLINERATTSELQLGVVREIASRDALTGVKSRHAYQEKERELDEQIGNRTAGDFGIVVCDLNGLKLINDEFGHKAGDERIRQASRLICELFSHSPVYRNGGDEFVVYLAGRDYEDRAQLMQALHDRSVANIETGDVVVSGGLAVFDRNADARLRPVFDRADAAMYKEKQLLKGMGAKTR